MLHSVPRVAHPDRLRYFNFIQSMPTTLNTKNLELSCSFCVVSVGVVFVHPLISPSSRLHTTRIHPRTYIHTQTRSPRRLRLWNTKKDHSICEVNFQTAVLSVKLNRKRVAVCLKQALHVFDISDMKCLRTLETALNPDGVMALSPNDDNCHLAFPDGARGGSSGSGNSTGGGEVIYINLSCFINGFVYCFSFKTSTVSDLF